MPFEDFHDEIDDAKETEVSDPQGPDDDMCYSQEHSQGDVHQGEEQSQAAIGVVNPPPD